MNNFEHASLFISLSTFVGYIHRNTMRVQISSLYGSIWIAFYICMDLSSCPSVFPPPGYENIIVFCLNQTVLSDLLMMKGI